MPDSLPRQPFLNDGCYFLAKFSQFSDGFLTFLKMTGLIVYIWELIHFGNTLDSLSLHVIFLKLESGF